ncbi:MAG: hypothetical protein M3Q70_03850, partial [bacterium]|nr:hypothetical protein [bacterium]
MALEYLAPIVVAPDTETLETNNSVIQEIAYEFSPDQVAFKLQSGGYRDWIPQTSFIRRIGTERYGKPHKVIWEAREDNSPAKIALNIMRAHCGNQRVEDVNPDAITIGPPSKK